MIVATEYRYHKVSPSFWTDRKVLGWDDDTRLLALYIMTCEHRTTEGLFRLPKAYICADMGWSSERLDIPFAILLRDGFIQYDETVSVMLLTNALKWNPTDNVNHAKGAVKNIVGLPETPLLQAFIRLAERYDERLYKQLVERYGKPQALTQTQSQTQSQAQEQERAGARDGGDDVVDDEVKWREFRQRFGEAFGGLPNQAHIEETHTFLDDGMDLELVIEALRLTALNKGRTWSYTRKILNAWHHDGIHDLAQLQEVQARDNDARASPNDSTLTEGLRNALRSAHARLAKAGEQRDTA